jgi:hypothetical protein
MDMFGPTSLRRNDLTLLRLSTINECLCDLQAEVEAKDHFHIFGESAYMQMSNLKSYFKSEGDIDKRKWNSAMKKVRISIEWNYGYQASLFGYLANTRKLKLLESTTVTKVYTVATLLRNFHTISYGGQSSNYFNLSFPANTLVHYINGTDLA